MKKKIGLLLSLALTVSSFPLFTYATADNAIIEIRTADDLRKVGGKENVTFKLMNDIDLSDTVSGGVHTAEGGWVPLDHFNAIFDGNGYSIKNLNIYSYNDLDGSEEYNLGLFKSIEADAVVKNLDISVNINKSSTTVDKFGAICGYNDGTIENCSVSGSITCNVTQEQLDEDEVDDSIKASDRVRIGGVCGRNNGYVKNCYSNVNISTTNTYAYVGGISGGNAGGDIITSYNTGKIDAQTETKAGSIYAFSNSSSLVEKCYALDNNIDKDSPLEGVKILTSAEMSDLKNFEGFDFQNTWYMGYTTYTYPVLKSIRRTYAYVNPASGGSIYTPEPVVVPTQAPAKPVATATPVPTVKAQPVVSAVDSLSVVCPKKKRIRITYSPVTVTGYEVRYEIQYSPYKGMKSKTTKDVKKTKVVVKNLKKPKYFVRVRAYVDYNGTNIYSTWSSKIKVLMK